MPPATHLPRDFFKGASIRCRKRLRAPMQSYSADWDFAARHYYGGLITAEDWASARRRTLSPTTLFYFSSSIGGRRPMTACARELAPSTAEKFSRRAAPPPPTRWRWREDADILADYLHILGFDDARRHRLKISSRRHTSRRATLRRRCRPAPPARRAARRRRRRPSQACR